MEVLGESRLKLMATAIRISSLLEQNIASSTSEAPQVIPGELYVKSVTLLKVHTKKVFFDPKNNPGFVMRVCQPGYNCPVQKGEAVLKADDGRRDTCEVGLCCSVGASHGGGKPT